MFEKYSIGQKVNGFRLNNLLAYKEYKNTCGKKKNNRDQIT